VAVATSGKKAFAAVLLVMMVWSSSCSAPPPPPGPALQSSENAPAKPSAPASAVGRTPCFGHIPAAWTDAFRARSVETSADIGFEVDATAGDIGFGQYTSASESGVGELDLSTGRISHISPYTSRDAGGVGGMVVELPWLVWEQLDSSADLTNWSVHAWNKTTGESFVLATSRQPDGTLAKGEQPLPVLRAGRVAWAQPIPSAASGIVRSEVRVVDLRTRQLSVVASGRVGSPVFAGPYLIWGTVEGNAAFSFNAVDANTLKPATLPPQLGKPDSIGQLAGSADYLVWSNRDYTELVVWRIGSAHHDQFSSHDGVHFFQFMKFAGQFLVWFGGGASSVLDLSTGNGFDVPGTVTGSAESIITTEKLGQPKTNGASVASRVSRISAPAAPSITSCS
jgi:hypothetical protein